MHACVVSLLLTYGDRYTRDNKMEKVPLCLDKINVCCFTMLLRCVVVVVSQPRFYFTYITLTILRFDIRMQYIVSSEELHVSGPLSPTTVINKKLKTNSMLCEIVSLLPLVRRTHMRLRSALEIYRGLSTEQGTSNMRFAIRS